MLTEITLENFRCFHEKQIARLAPLTLLVGENSTGKTSFLAAVRVLSCLASNDWDLDFKEPPVDLGTFDDIIHNRGGHSAPPISFELGFAVAPEDAIIINGREEAPQCRATFAQRGTSPTLIRRRLSAGCIETDEILDSDTGYVAEFCTDRGRWQLSSDGRGHTDFTGFEAFGWPRHLADVFTRRGVDIEECIPLTGSPVVTEDEIFEFGRLASFFQISVPVDRAFISAPVRAEPQRTYDPARIIRDPYGEYVPMLLAETAFEKNLAWSELKRHLETFGIASGMFDEIRVRHLYDSMSSPFQIQVRKGGKGRKGPFRNLIDVGYGISQVLPVLTEILRADAPRLSLLQQPDLHLHPSAQAALATLFCNLAADGKQLIIETHGDHLLDRVRMDIRDGTTNLKPEDISILYFERTGLDVQIHSLRFDAQGNVLDAPPGYRQFFLEETHRSVWGND